MRLTRPSAKLFLFLLLSAVIVSGQACGGSNVQKGTPPEVTLEVWNVFEPRSHYEPIIEAYEALHPNVTINYRNLTFAEYEDELINALAEDRGPDIFSIQNTWTQRYLNKITPLPAQLTVPYVYTQGSIKKRGGYRKQNLQHLLYARFPKHLY